MPAVYTRTGDQGLTGLFGGTRLPKQSLPVEAYGTVDEANSAIGYAKQWAGEYADVLTGIQRRLFTLAAELASDEKGLARLGGTINQTDVDDLEHLIDGCLELAGPIHTFVIPGRDVASASLHQARTIVRRAERRVLALAETQPVRPELIRYLNRLSDALYAIARVKESAADRSMIEAVVRRVVSGGLDSPASTPGAEYPFDLATAKAMAEAAEAKAAQMNVPVVFAAVDAGGNLMLVHRMADSLLASLDIAINKAYTAAAMKSATADLRQSAGVDGPLYGIESSNQGRLVLFGGGLPIFCHDQIAGGIGVSGGSVEEDVTIVTYSYNKILRS